MAAAAAAAAGVVSLVLLEVAGCGGGSKIISDNESQPHACISATMSGVYELGVGIWGHFCLRCGGARGSCQKKIWGGLDRCTTSTAVF